MFLVRDEDLVEQGIPEVQGKGFPLAFPGDLVLIYREGQGGEAGEGVKEEVARAYDRVASTAEIQGDLDLAARVMGRLGYSPEQVACTSLLSSQRRQTLPNCRSQLPGGTAPTTRGLVVPIQRPTFKRVSRNRFLQV